MKKKRREKRKKRKKETVSDLPQFKNFTFLSSFAAVASKRRRAQIHALGLLPRSRLLSSGFSTPPLPRVRPFSSLQGKGVPERGGELAASSTELENIQIGKKR